MRNAEENNQAENKQVVRDFIQTVWAGGDLGALARYWTEDCINHALPAPDNQGLGALQAYHEQFLAAFAAFSDRGIHIVQQVAEGDRVVTHLHTTGQHSEPFMGMPATGRHVSLATIRIDRMQNGKIAEHWSVADMAGLMQQLGA